jgi:hypothetical protein
MNTLTQDKPIVIDQSIVDQIIYLEQNVTENKFAIGDILVALVDTFDGRKREVCDYLQGATTLDWKTLASYETTARRWPPDLRRQYAPLSFSVFRNMDPANNEDLALLDEAVDNQMTTNKILDIKFDRNSPGYVLRSCIRMLTKIEGDSELEEIITRLERKLSEYSLAEFIVTR